MYCTNCGRQIDDDSQFCPYCGNTAVGTNDSGVQEKKHGKAADRQKMKKPVPVKYIAGGGAVLLLLVCIIIFRSVWGRKIENSFLGRMFSLSWSEISDMSARNFRDLLKEEDISYGYEEGSGLDWSLNIKETSRFMDSDAGYAVEFDSDNTYSQTFIMLYETREDCTDSYEDIKEYLDKNLVKNTCGIDRQLTEGLDLFDDFWSYELSGMDIKEGGIYFLDKSSNKEDLDKYFELMLKRAEQKGEDLSDEEREELRKEVDESVLYKTAVFAYGNIDDMSHLQEYFALDDAYYSNSVCYMKVNYVLETEAQINSIFAILGWDANAGREIDIEKVKESLDADFQRAVDKYLYSSFGTADGDRRSIYDRAVYSALYMMDKYNLNALETKDIDKKNKNFWYITNFEYDMEKGEAINLSRYMDSTDIYCAVEYNYDLGNEESFASDLDRKIYLATKGYDINSGAVIDLSGYMGSTKIYCAVMYNYDVDNSLFFENDLARVLYLVDWNYNMETGGSFGSEDEKRLWLMKYYGYDIVAGREVNKEVGEALQAYQEYINENELGNYFKFCVVYIDEDDVPEIYAQSGSHAGGDLLLTYHEGIVHENAMSAWGLSYVEKKNFYISGYGWGGYFEDVFCTLEGGSASEIARGAWELGDGNGEHYRWNNGEECSAEDYENARNSLINSMVGDAVWNDVGNGIPYYDDCYSDVLLAYDASRTATYTAYVPQIAEFEISNGVLNASTNDGSRYGWISKNPFTISYPVAENCIWESGYYLDDFVHEGDTDYETVKGIIESDQAYYEELIAENGIDWFLENNPTDSPTGINIVVTDGVVVRVYTTNS